MNEIKTEQEIIEHKNTKSEFVDYTRFEVDVARRNAERDAFVGNLEYTPDYN